MRNAYNIFYYIFFFLVGILPDKSDHRYYLFITTTLYLSSFHLNVLLFTRLYYCVCAIGRPS